MAGFLGRGFNSAAPQGFRFNQFVGGAATRARALASALPSLRLLPAWRESRYDFDYFVNKLARDGLPDSMYGARITPSACSWRAGAVVRVVRARARAPLSRRLGKAGARGWPAVIEVSGPGGGVPSESPWARRCRFKGLAEVVPLAAESETFLARFGSGPHQPTRRPEAGAACVRPARRSATRAEFDRRQAHGGVLLNWPLARRSVRAFARLRLLPSSDADPLMARMRAGSTAPLILAWDQSPRGADRGALPEGDAGLWRPMLPDDRHDQGDLRGGEGFYDDFYVRDGPFRLGLEEAGFHDFAARAIDRFCCGSSATAASNRSATSMTPRARASGPCGNTPRSPAPRLSGARTPACCAPSTGPSRRARLHRPSPLRGLPDPARPTARFSEGHDHIVGYDLWPAR